MGILGPSLVCIVGFVLYLLLTGISGAVNIPDKKHFVEFTAKGTPHFLKIVGHAENSCMGIVQKGSGTVQCRLDAFKTGIALRDTHMLEYLNAKDHPMVSLKFQATDNVFEGILELKGVQKRVSGTFQAEPLKLSFHFNIADFGIKEPKYLGVGIDPDISVVAGIE
jgi:hypothetical protein